MNNLKSQIVDIINNFLEEYKLVDARTCEGEFKGMHSSLTVGGANEVVKEIEGLIAHQVREARIDGIREYADALIDLFVNPPAELGAAEDMHLHPWQIKNMILESLNHLDELKGDDK